MMIYSFQTFINNIFDHQALTNQAEKFCLKKIKIKNFSSKLSLTRFMDKKAKKASYFHSTLIARPIIIQLLVILKGPFTKHGYAYFLSKSNLHLNIKQSKRNFRKGKSIFICFMLQLQSIK